MKKGFTLIELLAVILILGIIALIAIPTVNNILKEARRGAFNSTLTNLEKVIEEKCTLEQIKNTEITTEYTITDGVISPSLDIKGDLPDGTITVNTNCEVSFTLSDNNFTGNKDFVGDIVITDGSSIEQKYKEAILNGADPVYSSNLIPVIIEDDGTVKKANVKEKWYSYEEKIWANAVILFDEDTYNPGDTISEDAIKQYYVWLPRYKYKLWNVNSEQLYPNGTSESPIDIVFENKNTKVSNGDENGEWLTHPAFTAFDTNGLWIGKFETSYNEETFTDTSLFLSTDPNITALTTGLNIIIKPNVKSLTEQSIGDCYKMAREVNTTLNSHMTKNTEWGAIAYLTYSLYGKCNETTCEEVYLNNIIAKNHALTGCSASSVSAGRISSNRCDSGYAWNGENNKASTTGNISGIYDMSGGTSEYVMGKGFSKYTILEPNDTKYYDFYEEAIGILGDATSEVTSNETNLWYNDDACFVNQFNEWFQRGGVNNSNTSAGIMNYDYTYAAGHINSGFRIILAF